MPANLLRHLDRAMKLRESFADVKLESIICEYPHSGMDETRVCPFDLEGYSTVGAYHVPDQAECRYHVHLIAETGEQAHGAFTFAPITNFVPITTNPDLIRLKSEFLELCQLIEGATDTDAVPRVCIRIHRLMKLKTVYRSTTDSLAKRVAVRDSPFGSVPVRTRWSNCEDLIAGLEWLANHDEQQQTATHRTECEDLKQSNKANPIVRRDRTKEELFWAALRKHHAYDDVSFNYDPASTRQIEELTENEVSDSTVCRYLKSAFGSVANYRRCCADETIFHRMKIRFGEISRDGLREFLE